MVSAAIRAALDEAGHSQKWLAEQIGESESVVSRLKNGVTKDITVDRVVTVERALGLPPGQLFRNAGLVHEPTSVREAIEADPLLGQRRDAVLDLYDASVERARRDSSSTTTSKSPTAARRRRK